MELKNHYYWIAGLLELGRNWALSIGIMVAASTFFYVEYFSIPIKHHEFIGTFLVLFSFVWMILSCLRFKEYLDPSFRGKTNNTILFFIIILFICSGILVISLIAKVKDSQRIVAICNMMENKPESEIYED